MSPSIRVVAPVALAAVLAAADVRMVAQDPDRTATIKQSDGTTVAGVIAGRLALGDRADAVALVYGRDIERIDEDGVRLRFGADVLRGVLTIVDAADASRYRTAQTTPRLPLLELLVANEPPLAMRSGATASVEVRAPQKSRMRVNRGVMDRVTTLTGRDAVVIGELRLENGTARLIEALAVMTAGGGMTLPVTSVAAPNPRRPAARSWREERLSPEEERDALAFGRTFTSRMAQTRDVSRLLPDFFVREFGVHLVDLLASDNTAGLIVNLQAFNVFHLPLDVQQQLGPESLQEYFLRTANFWYLTLLYRFSAMPTGRGPGSQTLQQVLPADAASVLAESAILRPLLERPLFGLMSDSSRERSGKSLLNDLGQVRETLSVLERFAAVMRLRVTTPPAEGTEYYRQWASLYDSEIGRGRGRATLLARATVCGTGCGRLPAGTRFLEVTALPFWHLHLIRTPDGLRIFALDLPTD